MAPPDVLPPPPGALSITLDFEPSDDPEITCIVCNGGGCDLSVTVYQGPRHMRVTMGKHTKCTWVMVKRKLAGVFQDSGLRLEKP
jgi:hypothetical protein